MSAVRGELDAVRERVEAALADEGFEVVDSLLVEGCESPDPVSERWRVEFVDTRSSGAARGLALVSRPGDPPVATVAVRDEHGRGVLVSVLSSAAGLREHEAPSPFVSNADYRRLLDAASALSRAAREALRDAAALPVDTEDPFSLLGTPALERHVLATRVLDLSETRPGEHEDAVRLALDLSSGAPAEWALHRVARRGPTY